MGSFPNQNFLTGKPANENLYVQTFLNEKIKKDIVFSEGIPLARRRNRTDVSQHATLSFWLQECWPDNATLNKMVSGRCGANPRLALALCRHTHTHTHTEQMQNHPQFQADHCVLRSQ